MKNNQHARTYLYLLIACLASLIISTMASYFFYRKWNEAENLYVLTMKEKNTVSRNYNILKNSFDKAFADLLIMRDENAGVFTLHAADSTKRFSARVFWNHYTRETFIDVLSLPPADSAMQYQLWAFVASQPADAGVFNADPDEGLEHVRPVLNADAWAVTLEPKGGSPAPTMERLYLISGN